MDRIEDFRRVFAEVVVTRAGCQDATIREAFERVPRHEFVGPGPWQLTERGDVTSSRDPALVYQDMGLGLGPERTIPTGLPSLHARCLGACAIPRGARVVHVGAGTGYYTAILAELVGPAGHVLAFELDPALGALACHNLEPWPWVRLEARSGVDQVEAADRIYVSAGVEALPAVWIHALRPGGSLLFPLMPAPTEGTELAEEGGVLLVREVGLRQRFAAQFVCRARFVPCIGTQSPAIRDRLAVAFRSRTHERVRSLGIGKEPDAGVWLSGDNWWLSTQEAWPEEPDRDAGNRPC